MPRQGAHDHWQASSFNTALRIIRIDATFLVDGSPNMDVFKAYVERILCPELAEGNVILDDPCIPKTPTVARLIAERGATPRFLPPCNSPDLDPTELAFSKFKRHLRRRAASTASTTPSATAYPSSIPFTAEASIGMPNTELTNLKQP